MFTILVVAALAGCQQGQVTNPPHKDMWLSRKDRDFYPITHQVGNDGETVKYYNTIDPDCKDPTNPACKKNTFDGWKSANGFGSGPELRAVYFNGGDLQLGRDMHCKRVGSFDIACYVTNFGPPPFLKGAPNLVWPDASQALVDAVAAATNQPGNPPFATVAMEFSPSPGEFPGVVQGPNNVKFYVFASDGTRSNFAALDIEGDKFVPQMCMACHGGQYDKMNHAATGASFLPFDVFTFQYSQTSPFTMSDQQEQFRLLNALVEETTPNPTNPNHPIESLINDWYKSCVGGVNTKDCTPVDYSKNNPPPGWAGPGQFDIYFGVVRYYCQTCHVAEGPDLDWTKYSEFKAYGQWIRSDVCSSHTMPHAEISQEHYVSNPIALLEMANFLDGQNLTCP